MKEEDIKYIHELEEYIHELEERVKELEETIEKQRDERNQLIEGLRFYADAQRYWSTRTNPFGFVESSEICKDNGKRAREILKEIGVTANG